MSRIASAFTPKNHKALIAYITVGYPSLQSTIDTAILLAESGCDIIELGIPFSDPIADGITITKASHHALKNGITPEACLDVAAYLSKKIRIPLMFMSYYNPVFKYDLEKFCHKCTLNGIDGLIIPDLPPDEGEIIDKICQKNDLDIVYLLAPNCSDDRIRLVSRRSKGFIYLVSVTGVTGVRNELPENIGTFVSRVKRIAGPKPLCVGFGISTAAQAVKAARLADGIIIGSRIIQLLEPVNTAEAPLQTYIKEIRQSLDYL